MVFPVATLIQIYQSLTGAWTGVDDQLMMRHVSFRGNPVAIAPRRSGTP